MKRIRRKKEVDVNFDSLADIVSNILGILVILGVMVGLLVQTDEEQVTEHEREKVIGRQDALNDIIYKDKRLELPLERDGRYNQFHVHVICYQNKVFFVDFAELYYLSQKNGVKKFNEVTNVGSVSVLIDENTLQTDRGVFTPLLDKGVRPSNSAEGKAQMRKHFNLEKRVEEGRELTWLRPNNHVIHFHVFSDSFSAYQLANDYLRSLGFATGWQVHEKNINGMVVLPVYLRRHSNHKNLYVQ